MLSQSEYERQGEECTRQAIEALRISTAETWGDVKTQVCMCTFVCVLFPVKPRAVWLAHGK